MLIFFCSSSELDLAVFSVYWTLSSSVIIAHRLIAIGYLFPPLHFFRYCENELLLLILDADIVFSSTGVATVRALLISLVVFLFFLLVEQRVFWRSIKAYKKSWGENFLHFSFDFDFDFDFFLLLLGFNGEVAGFFFSPRLFIT